MDCPACKAVIDDDSAFCDQCGAEVMKCPQCGRVGKGKRCIFDGQPLQPAGNVAASASPPATTPPQMLPPSPPSPSAAAGKVLHLRSSAHGIDLVPASGDVLGRSQGPHAATLGRLTQISSSHMRIAQGPDGRWQATDLKSTNGSRHNGSRMAAHVAQPLDAGDTLNLADIPFTVTLE
jgi:hypothetical protein